MHADAVLFWKYGDDSGVSFDEASMIDELENSMNSLEPDEERGKESGRTARTVADFRSRTYRFKWGYD